MREARNSRGKRKSLRRVATIDSPEECLAHSVSTSVNFTIFLRLTEISISEFQEIGAAVNKDCCGYRRQDTTYRSK